MNPFKRSALNDPRSAPRAEKPEPAVAEGGIATIRLYDAIDSWGGWWGVSAKEFGAALDALPDDTQEIRLLINSPGGEIWDGLAILNQLRSHRARVVAVVEGLAASAASFIAAGVDECVMAANSEMFIHNAMGVGIGDAELMREVAADLDRHDRNLASIYARKTGKDADFWLAEMQRDRFLTAEEAVELGLADRIEGVGDADSAKARFDLSVFSRPEPGKHAAILDDSITATHIGVARVTSDQLQADVRAALNLPSSAEPGAPNQKEELIMSDTNEAGLRERLGATDAGAVEGAPLAAADSAPAQAEISTLPEGAVVMDAEALAQLRADAAAGREAREQQTAERRDSIVAAALKDGRIAKASRDHWRAQLDKDEEGISALLDAMPKNAAVPVDELGHADAAPAAEADDAYPAHWKR